MILSEPSFPLGLAHPGPRLIFRHIGANFIVAAAFYIDMYFVKHAG